MKAKVLFVGVHNSTRSQMAEAILNHYCPEDFFAESAGMEPGFVNPLVAEVLREVGIDLSAKGTQAVFDLFKEGRRFSHVISVCDRIADEKCPVFLGIGERHQWSFPAPVNTTGAREERLEEIRVIRGMIEARVREWCAKQCAAI